MLTLTIHLIWPLDLIQPIQRQGVPLDIFKGNYIQGTSRNITCSHHLSNHSTSVTHPQLTLRNRNPTDRLRIPHNRASKIHLQNPTNWHLMKSKTMNPHPTDCLKTQITTTYVVSKEKYTINEQNNTLEKVHIQ